jgi:hypothetical protein
VLAVAAIAKNAGKTIRHSIPGECSYDCFSPQVTVMPFPPCHDRRSEVIGTLRACGGLTDLLHGRDQQRDQDGDDGDDHEQLTQGEALTNSFCIS